MDRYFDGNAADFCGARQRKQKNEMRRLQQAESSAIRFLIFR